MKFIIVLLLFFAAIHADDDYERRHINKELSHLDLSKEQSIEIKKIVYDFRLKLREFEIFKKEIENKKENMFLKEFFYTDEFDRLSKELDTKAREIEKNFLLKIHAVLNLKQRTKFIKHFDDWKVE